MKILKESLTPIPMVIVEGQPIEFDNSSIGFIFKDNSCFYLNLHDNNSFVNATNISISDTMPENYKVIGKVCIGASFKDYVASSKKEDFNVRVIAPTLLSKLKIINIMGLV